MNTFLGCASDLHAPDMNASRIADAAILFIEGYLWDSPSTKAAIRTAIAHAHAAGRKVALTLSDPFCVGRWREEFLELMKSDVDILFANEDEAKSLFQATSFDGAFQSFRTWGKTAAITRSAKGSVVVHGGAVHIIDAEPVDRVIDTTGAGDQFAAGFLFGTARGLPLDVCGRLGSIAAAEVISHFGPRPQVSLKALAGKAGLV
jgi:sugar/nucleoside kinase (ribokinase family)